MSHDAKREEFTSDEDDLGDEGTSFLQLRSRTRRYNATLKSNSRRGVAMTLFTYLMISCMSVLCYELVQRRFVHQDSTINLLPGRDLLPFFPHNKVIRFEPNTTYYGAKSLPAWWALNAKGGGFIAVENGEELDLGPPLRMNKQEGYGISVFHQLHCMATIRQDYQQALSGNITHLAATAYHIEHCFDYIRQVLMCHADLGLEHRMHWAGEGPDYDQTDGWGTLHQCRDWNAVVRFAEEKRMSKGWTPPPDAPGVRHHNHGS